MISGHESLIEVYSERNHLKTLLGLKPDSACDIDIENIYVEETLRYIFGMHGKGSKKTPDICAVLYNHTYDQIEHIFVIEIKSSFSNWTLIEARKQIQGYINAIDRFFQDENITCSGIIIVDFYRELIEEDNQNNLFLHN
ncbi:MAG: hypothetical protein KAJ56_01200 [Candidatus Aenigmarchaeota archaeon]|nr:hypothetical protein [Candidatus Aenigmarchaeota archaeon]